jgi:hypothetical protein
MQETSGAEEQETAVRRTVRLITALHTDVKACRAAPDHNTQLGRRQYARTVFAAVEGAIYVFKQLVLHEVEDRGLHLSSGEELFLEEVEYRLNDRGEVERQRAKITFINNLKFSFRLFAQVHGLKLQLQTGGDGWCALKESIKVRDRLAHPKRVEDLTVTDDEFRKLNKAYYWFASTAMIYFAEATRTLDVQVMDLKKEVSLLERAAAMLSMQEDAAQ